MLFEFVKCHGSGNDFPMLDARGIDLSDADWARIAVALADRRGPVGGDGILLLDDGDAESAFGMVMRNSDGSEAETCLNGLRCVARAGFEALGIRHAVVRLKTSHATVAHEPDLMPGVYIVRETAGPASLDIAAWPVHVGAARLIEQPIAQLGSDRRFTAVAMPNPHLVAFVADIDDAELSAIGRRCEAAPDWLPNRANVSFVTVLEPGMLFVRTFERGVGLTDSCGSAMAAAVFAAGLTGRCAFGGDLVVRNRGGMVRGLAQADGMVTLSGNATYEWAGTIEIDPATGATGPLSVTRRYPEETAAWQAVRAAATAKDPLPATNA